MTGLLRSPAGWSRRETVIEDRGSGRRRREEGWHSFASVADALSLFRQPRFAQSFGQGGRNRKTLRHHLDGQLGIGAKRFRQDGLRLLHFALERIGPGHVDHTIAITNVDRFVLFLYGGVQMPEPALGVTQSDMP
jgi:hypothetical protein